MELDSHVHSYSFWWFLERKMEHRRGPLASRPDYDLRDWVLFFSKAMERWSDGAMGVCEKDSAPFCCASRISGNVHYRSSIYRTLDRKLDVVCVYECPLLECDCPHGSLASTVYYNTG